MAKKKKKVSPQKACSRKNSMVVGLLDKGLKQNYPNMLKKLKQRHRNIWV